MAKSIYGSHLKNIFLQDIDIISGNLELSGNCGNGNSSESSAANNKTVKV